MERQQQVVVEGESSDSCIVDSGVPQGTVFLTLTFPVSYQYLTCQSEINSKIDCLLLIYKTIRTIQDQIQLQNT